MLTSTDPHRGRRPGRFAALAADWRPNRPPTPAVPDMPVLTECRCAATATTPCPTATGGSALIMPPRPAQRVRLNRPAPTTSRRGSWPPTAVRSPWRTAGSPPGPSCGANGSPCSAPARSSPRWRPNAPPPAAGCTGPAPDPPRSASTVYAGREPRKPCLSAPMTARRVGCAVIATSPQRCSRPASTSPTPTTRPPHGSTSILPAPSGRR